MMYGQLCTEFYDTDKKFAPKYELELYQDLFSKDDLLFEPMCGSGRLLIPLMQLGYTIHGIDNSKAMLDSCKKRAKAFDLTPVVYEKAFSAFNTEQQYNGIIIPLGSFQLFYPREEAYSALEKFYALLLPGGKLVIDLFVPWEVMHERSDVDKSTNQVTLASGKNIKIDNYTTSNKFNQHMLSKTHYAKYKNNKIISEEDEKMDILWYYQFEMELMLEKYGFKEIKCINRFLNGCEHMTFIAMKK